jgi:Ca2+-binding RTX toxin-like protein
VNDVAEVFRGSSKGGVINTGRGDDIALGKTGKDVIMTNAGNDRLDGGYGNDVLKGGVGRDTFVFATKLHKTKNVDKIIDFSSKDDTIELAKSIFSKMQKGKMKAGAFFVGKEAHDASDRVIYDKAKGILFYDKDGTGGADQVKFATVHAKLKLSLSDFFVV